MITGTPHADIAILVLASSADEYEAGISKGRRVIMSMP